MLSSAFPEMEMPQLGIGDCSLSWAHRWRFIQRMV
jgi:hypothetical protein